MEPATRVFLGHIAWLVDTMASGVGGGREKEDGEGEEGEEEVNRGGEEGGGERGRAIKTLAWGMNWTGPQLYWNPGS